MYPVNSKYIVLSTLSTFTRIHIVAIEQIINTYAELRYLITCILTISLTETLYKLFYPIVLQCPQIELSERDVAS